MNKYHNKALHEPACMLIEHYELLLYHPALHRAIKHQLLSYACKEGLLEFVQGYVTRAKMTLEEVVLK